MYNKGTIPCRNSSDEDKQTFIVRRAPCVVNRISRAQRSGSRWNGQALDYMDALEAKHVTGRSKNRNTLACPAPQLECCHEKRGHPLRVPPTTGMLSRKTGTSWRVPPRNWNVVTKNGTSLACPANNWNVVTKNGDIPCVSRPATGLLSRKTGTSLACPANNCRVVSRVRGRDMLGCPRFSLPTLLPRTANQGIRQYGGDVVADAPCL
jgi:hypothetical protein